MKRESELFLFPFPHFRTLDCMYISLVGQLLFRIFCSRSNKRHRRFVMKKILNAHFFPSDSLYKNAHPSNVLWEDAH